MKTISELVKEFKNRHAKPEYSSILLCGDNSSQRFYTNVTNVKSDGTWLEFDNEHHGEHKHIKTLASIAHFENILDE